MLHAQSSVLENALTSDSSSRYFDIHYWKHIQNYYTLYNTTSFHIFHIFHFLGTIALAALVQETCILLRLGIDDTTSALDTSKVARIEQVSVARLEVLSAREEQHYLNDGESEDDPP